MDYALDVQMLVQDPLGGRSEADVRRLCSTELARVALAHEPPRTLIERFCEQHSYSYSDAVDLFEETKRFLVVGRLLGKTFAPSLPVDNMWHSWLLFTQDYHAFCACLGGYIHHRPVEKGSPEQPPLEPTVKAMATAFGSVSDRWWPQELGAYGIMDCKQGP